MQHIAVVEMSCFSYWLAKNHLLKMIVWQINCIEPSTNTRFPPSGEDTRRSTTSTITTSYIYNVFFRQWLYVALKTLHHFSVRAAFESVLVSATSQTCSSCRWVLEGFRYGWYLVGEGLVRIERSPRGTCDLDI